MHEDSLMWAAFHAFHVAYYRRLSCSACTTASLLWKISYSCNDQPCLYSGNRQVCIYGESVHVVIMDGLHLEMAIWNMLIRWFGRFWLGYNFSWSHRHRNWGSGGPNCPKFYNLSIEIWFCHINQPSLVPLDLRAFLCMLSWLKQRCPILVH